MEWWTTALIRPDIATLCCRVVVIAVMVVSVRTKE